MKCLANLRLMTLLVMIFSSPVVSASYLTLEEVFELYSKEEISEAFFNNRVRASMSENPEDVPFYVQYTAVFQDLLWNPVQHRYKFIGDDWDKMLSLPSHQHSPLFKPYIDRQASDCQDIMAIINSNAASSAMDVAKILDAQTLAETTRLNQHYQTFIATLSGEARVQLQAEYERVMLNNGASIGWGAQDHVGLAGVVPEYVETMAANYCLNVVEKLQSRFWANYEATLADEAPIENDAAGREEIYATLPQNPLFTGEMLHIPLVNSDNENQVYQRVELEPLSDELFQLKSVRQSHHLLYVNNIEFSSFAVDQRSAMQVFLTVKGYFSSGCGGLGASVTNYDENTQTIFVDLYSRTSPLPPGEYVCTGQVIDYLIYQPLPVYGLPAGEYQVVVNGSYSLPLIFSEENVHENLAGSTVIEPINYSAVLDDNALKLPFVDMPDQAGKYQQIELQEVAENHWQIADIRQARTLEGIKTVELVEYEDSVKEIFLKVQGNYGNGCVHPGNVVSRFDNETNTLEVNIYEYLPDETEVENGICASGSENFDFVYPLPVYGAPAGDYHVLVNGQFALQFTLLKNNSHTSMWRPFGTSQPDGISTMMVSP